MGKCRCLFPAVIADQEICEATGGECIPDPFGDLPTEAGANSPGRFCQAPEAPSTGAPLPQTPDVQYVAHVPLDYFDPWIHEDPERRRYIWEE